MVVVVMVMVMVMVLMMMMMITIEQTIMVGCSNMFQKPGVTSKPSHVDVANLH
jgi:ectoine hydroxylase-related dioxygenase (phytanoyl-CoA dioxygenase family)